MTDPLRAPISAYPDRRRTVGELGLQQRVWLARGLVARCGWRLEQLLGRSDPLDLPLSKFLKGQIAAEEESADSLKRLDWSLHQEGAGEFCTGTCGEFLKGLLPSTYGRPGEGLMDRDAALHFVEILQTERHAFFSKVLDGLAGDPFEPRLKTESDRSAERLRLVSTILLPPVNSSELPGPASTINEPSVAAADRRSWGVALSGEINQLRRLLRTSSAVGHEAAVLAGLLVNLATAASDDGKIDEPLTGRFIQEFDTLRHDGSGSPADMLEVARVALAWLLCGHTRRSSPDRSLAQSGSDVRYPIIQLSRS